MLPISKKSVVRKPVRSRRRAVSNSPGPDSNDQINSPHTTLPPIQHRPVNPRPKINVIKGGVTTKLDPVRGGRSASPKPRRFLQKGQGSGGDPKATGNRSPQGKVSEPAAGSERARSQSPQRKPTVRLQPIGNKGHVVRIQKPKKQEHNDGQIDVAPENQKTETKHQGQGQAGSNAGKDAAGPKRLAGKRLVRKDSKRSIFDAGPKDVSEADANTAHNDLQSDAEMQNDLNGGNLTHKNQNPKPGKRAINRTKRPDGTRPTTLQPGHARASDDEIESGEKLDGQPPETEGENEGEARNDSDGRNISLDKKPRSGKRRKDESHGDEQADSVSLEPTKLSEVPEASEANEVDDPEENSRTSSPGKKHRVKRPKLNKKPEPKPEDPNDSEISVESLIAEEEEEEDDDDDSKDSSAGDASGAGNVLKRPFKKTKINPGDDFEFVEGIAKAIVDSKALEEFKAAGDETSTAAAALKVVGKFLEKCGKMAGDALLSYGSTIFSIVCEFSGADIGGIPLDSLEGLDLDDGKALGLEVAGDAAELGDAALEAHEAQQEQLKKLPLLMSLLAQAVCDAQNAESEKTRLENEAHDEEWRKNNPAAYFGKGPKLGSPEELARRAKEKDRNEEVKRLRAIKPENRTSADWNRLVEMASTPTSAHLEGEHLKIDERIRNKMIWGLAKERLKVEAEKFRGPKVEGKAL